MKNTELQKLWPQPPEGALQHSTYLFNGKKLSRFLSYKKSEIQFSKGKKSIYKQFMYSDDWKLFDQEKGYKQLCNSVQIFKKGGFEWLSTSIKSLVESVQITGFSPCKKKIHFFKRKANHVKVTTNCCVSNRKIRKEGFGLPSGIAGIAHSFSASSSSVSLVWDVSSVKAPLECPLQGFSIFYFLFPEVLGSGHWQEGGGSKQWVLFVAADWDEIII